jgi:hypothetical protein
MDKSNSLTFKELLPNTQRVAGLLDQEIRIFCNDFYQNRFLTDLDNVQKQDILRETRETILKFLSPVIDLTDFRFMYPTNGITEGLYSLLLENQSIKMLEGDYEWIKLNSKDKVSYQVGDILYVSNPSSIDGNFIPDTEWGDILSNNDNIALDAAYLGSTSTKKISINDNVKCIYVGLSKMFGLQDLRIGYVFLRKPNVALGALLRNSYFNNNSLRLTIELMENFPLDFLHRKYREKQIEICELNNLEPSDVVYLATTLDEKFNFYRRGRSNRLCITNHILNEQH